MTSKEAVNLFKQYHWRVKDKNKALEILEELVERDTPMKVIKDTVINGVCLAYKCPNCELEINNSEYSKDQYYLIKGCISCLQRLDWSELYD